RPLVGRVVRAAAAPRWNASAMKSWPSARGPRRGTKRSPACRVRVSVLMPEMTGFGSLAPGLVTTRPPVAFTMSLRVNFIGVLLSVPVSSAMPPAPPRDHRTDASHHGFPDTVHALARDQDDIARPHEFYGP